MYQYLEAIRQNCKDNDIKRFLGMMSFIKQVEQAILVRTENNRTYMGVNIGNDMVVLETSDRIKRNEK